MALCILVEEFFERGADVGFVLDETFRACVHLPDFALAVLAQKPVVAKRLGVALLRQADDFGRLFLEAFQLSWPNFEMCVELERRHESSAEIPERQSDCCICRAAPSAGFSTAVSNGRMRTVLIAVTLSLGVPAARMARFRE